jgi:hypothetical protein
MPHLTESDLPIAKEDEVLHDENLGIDRKIFGGQRVPGDLLAAYEEKHGKTEETEAVEKRDQEEAETIEASDEERAKAERSPARDKAAKGAAKSKSSS